MQEERTYQMRMKIFVGILLIVLCVSVTFGQKTEASLRLIISSSKNTVRVYEPIRLTLVLVNASDEGLTSDFGLGGYRYREKLKICYRKKDEGFRDYPLQADEDGVECGPALLTTIPPHGQKRSSEILLYDRNLEQFILSEPGVYEFQVQYWYDHFQKKVISNMIQVTVKSSPSNEDPKAVLLWKDPSLARLAQDNWVHPDEKRNTAIEKLKALMKNYPSSVYTKAARKAVLGCVEEKKRLRNPISDLQKKLVEIVQQ